MRRIEVLTANGHRLAKVLWCHYLTLQTPRLPTFSLPLIVSQVQAKVDFLQQRLKDVREQKEQIQKALVRNSEAVTLVQSEVETALGSSESGKVMTVTLC